MAQAKIKKDSVQTEFFYLSLVGIADDAFYFFSFIKRDRKKIVLKCVHPTVVNDVDVLSRYIVHDDKCIFLIMTDLRHISSIEIYSGSGSLGKST